MRRSLSFATGLLTCGLTLCLMGTAAHAQHGGLTDPGAPLDITTPAPTQDAAMSLPPPTAPNIDSTNPLPPPPGYVPEPPPSAPQDAAPPPAPVQTAAAPMAEDPIAECRDKGGSSFFGGNRCLSDMLDSADAQLNKIESDQMKAARKADWKQGRILSQSLSASAMSFNAYRDSECVRQSMAADGAKPSDDLRMACQIRMTHERIASLGPEAAPPAPPAPAAPVAPGPSADMPPVEAAPITPVQADAQP